MRKFMVIRVYTEDDSSCEYKVYRLPQRIEVMNLDIEKDPQKNDRIGTIDMTWHSQKQADNYDYEYNNETIYFSSRKSYVMVDDHKFVLEDKNDLMELYKFLTGEDVNKFIKDFQSVEKEFSASKDFQ